MTKIAKSATVKPDTTNLISRSLRGMIRLKFLMIVSLLVFPLASTANDKSAKGSVDAPDAQGYELSVVRFKTETITLKHSEKKKKTVTEKIPVKKKPCRGGGLAGALRCKVTKPIEEAGQGGTKTTEKEITIEATVTVKVKPFLRTKAKPCDGEYLIGLKVVSADYNISSEFDAAKRTALMNEAKGFVKALASWTKPLSPAELQAFKKKGSIRLDIKSAYSGLSLLQAKPAPITIAWKKNYSRVTDVDGFCAVLEGPSNVKFGSTTGYTLVLYKGNKKASWAPLVTWKIKRNKDRNIKYATANNRGKTNQLVAPATSSDFQKKTIVLYARGSGTATGGVNVTKTVHKTVTISNVSDSCAKLQEKIGKLKKKIAGFDREIRGLKVDIEDLETNTSSDNTELSKLKQELQTKTSERDKLAKAVKDMDKLLQQMRSEYASLNSLRSKLWRSMTKKARIVSASGRYKASKKTARDKLDFVRGVFGRKPAIPKRPNDPGLDSWVAIAEKKAKDLKVQIAGMGLANLAGIATLPLPHPGGKFSIVFEGLKFALDTAIDSKVNASALSNEIKINEAQFKQLNAQGKRVQTIAKQIQRLKQQGASESKIKDLSVKLHREIIKYHVETVNAMNKLQPLMRKLQSTYAKMNSSLNKRNREVATLQKKVKTLQGQQQQDKQKQADNKLKQDSLRRKIKTIEGQRGVSQQRLAELQKEYKTKCAK